MAWAYPCMSIKAQAKLEVEKMGLFHFQNGPKLEVRWGITVTGVKLAWV